MVKISVLIPVRRDDRLIHCLQALKVQIYPKQDFEVVVVENDSQSRYEDLVVSSGYKHIKEERVGIGRALRTGQKFCRGKIIARLDADCIPIPAWLQSVENAFTSNRRLGIVGGPVPKYMPESWFERSQRALVIGAQVDLQYLRPISPLPYVVGANSAFRMIAFRATGGYRSCFTSGDDVDLCWRIQYLGYEISISKEMIAYHHCRSTMLGYLKSFYNYAIGHSLLFKMHRNPRDHIVVINWYPIVLMMKTIFCTFPIGLFHLILSDNYPIGKALFDLLESLGLLAGGIIGALRYRTRFL